MDTQNQPAVAAALNAQLGPFSAWCWHDDGPTLIVRGNETPACSNLQAPAAYSQMALDTLMRLAAGEVLAIAEAGETPAAMA